MSIVQRAAPAPRLPLPRVKVGDTALYMGNPENVWHITGLHEGMSHWWVFAEQGGTKQFLPAAVFESGTQAPAAKVKPDVVRVPVMTKAKKSSGDPVAMLLSEAADLAACWRIAELAGLNVAEVRSKIGHLSNGLQRMGIGNRLRKLEGFDPRRIRCNGPGNAADFYISEE